MKKLFSNLNFNVLKPSVDYNGKTQAQRNDSQPTPKWGEMVRAPMASVYPDEDFCLITMDDDFVVTFDYNTRRLDLICSLYETTEAPVYREQLENALVAMVSYDGSERNRRIAIAWDSPVKDEEGKKRFNYMRETTKPLISTHFSGFTFYNRYFSKRG